MPQRTADERTFNLLRRMRDERGAGITLAEFKAALREQGFMLLLDQERAVATLPQLLASASAEQGGFKWSSQRLDRGGCGDYSKAAFGSVRAGRAAVAGPAPRGAA
jgi:hypothetical protein